jgi:glucose/arabinose dehydrogenase
MSARPAAGLVATLTVSALALTACGPDGSEEESGGGPEVPSFTQPTETATQPTPSASAGESPGEGEAGRPRATTLVEGLAVPWGIDFLPDGDALVTERDSRRLLRVTPDGDVTELGTVQAAAPAGEAGLLGVAVSPGFDTDRRIFLYVTTEEDNRILRAEVAGDSLGKVEVVLDGIPQGFIHDGGRLAFGPDGYLYASTGETGTPDLAQDPGSLGGKILRVTADGEAAPGNPEPGSPVWSSGHRNVQGLAWDDDDRLWASEFGDSTWDELNLVEAGGNYGWPQVEGTGGGSGFIDPQLVWPVENASPSGLAWLDGHLWMAGLRGERLWRISVSDDGRASRPTPFFAGEYGRLRTVVAAPDGSLWLTTSNRDGRGAPSAADDRILRVSP